MVSLLKFNTNEFKVVKQSVFILIHDADIYFKGKGIKKKNYQYVIVRCGLPMRLLSNIVKIKQILTCIGHCIALKN